MGVRRRFIGLENISEIKFELNEIKVFTVSVARSVLL